MPSTPKMLAGRLDRVYKPLNEAQLAVLRWVAEGQPKGVYDEGFEHRITARALERRGLVKVRGHGVSWTAAVTSDGRYYLEHGRYEPSQEPPLAPAATRRQSRRSTPPAPTPVPIDDIVDQLRRAGGVLRIEAPSAVDRVSYRHAVDRARATGEVPLPERLKVTGVKRGPLIIELLEVADAAEPTIVVPEEVNPRHPAVRAIGKSESFAVSNEQKPRALALVQAIAEECRRRGWAMTFDESPGFVITSGQDSYRCLLLEEREKRDVFADADVAKRKYDWQRVSPTRADVYSGRLRLEIGQGYSVRWWADRKRWTLASKLGNFFDTLDELSTAARDTRSRIEQKHREDVAAWEQAVPRARERHIRALNADRAITQVAAWQRANELRAYASAVAAGGRPDTEDPHTQERAEWAEWLLGEANRIDPLTDPAQLHLDVPEQISIADLDKYMPKGWSSRHPPDAPRWLPS